MGSSMVSCDLWLTCLEVWSSYQDIELGALVDSERTVPVYLKHKFQHVAHTECRGCIDICRLAGWQDPILISFVP